MCPEFPPEHTSQVSNVAKPKQSPLQSLLVFQGCIDVAHSPQLSIQLPVQRQRQVVVIGLLMVVVLQVALLLLKTVE